MTQREISFEKEINIDDTCKKLQEIGFASIWDTYLPPLILLC